MKHCKLLSLLLAALIITSLFAACADNAQSTPTPTGVEGQNVSPDQKTTPEDTGKRDVGLGLMLPLADEPVTLVMWRPFLTEASHRISSMNENKSVIEKEKRTGVHINYIHPAIGTEDESFSLFIASQNYPDLIAPPSSASYVGGADKAIEDGVFLRLNEYLDEFAPNYMAMLKSDSTIYKLSSTDLGNIPWFSFILDGDRPPFMGPQMRKDWLDDLGLSIPQTYDDWHNALVKFKDEKGADAPLMLYNSGFDIVSQSYNAGYGVGNGFYNVDGVVKYGFLEPEMVEYLTMMQEWFSEGLIDPDYYAKTEYFPSTQYITTGRSGAWSDICLNISTNTTIAQEIDPDYHVVGVPYPRKNASDVAHLRYVYSRVTGRPVAISATSTNIELCIKWMDYRYSEEGILLDNYGVLGESYEVVNGEAQFLPSIYDNSDGIPFLDLVAEYTDAEQGCFEHYQREDINLSQDQVDTFNIWCATSDGAWVMPAISLTSEEGQEYSALYSTVQTFVTENIVKFITGQLPMSEYSSFVDSIKELKIDRCLAIQQAALDRFNNR
jgi:putative aldouronate transport system substrate-binding protein